MVVFDGIAGPDHPGAFQARDGRQQRRLHLLRQRGGDAVGIDRGVVEPLRLQEDLVAVALAEAHDLVLDRGAIARPAAGDLAGIHRRAVHIGADDGVGRRERAGDAAVDLAVGNALGQHRKRHRRVVAGLHFDRRPSRWWCRRGAAGCRSSAARGQSRTAPSVRDRPMAGRLADAAGRGLPLADMDEAAQEGAGGQHHGGGPQLCGRRLSRRPETAPPASMMSSASPSITVRPGVVRSAACMAAA